MPVILQVAFPWTQAEDEVRAASLAQARELSRRTEFLWKIILRDPKAQLSGAVYLFADREKAEAWRNDLFARRGTAIEARIFEIDEAASRLTRAPLPEVTTTPHATARSITVDQLDASNDE